MRVRRILLKYYRPRGFAGSEAIKTDLLHDLRREVRAYALAYSTVLALTVIAYLLLWMWLPHPLELAFALGVVSALAIWLSSRIAGGLSQCRLLLVIVADHRQDQLLDLIARIVEKRDG